jgi:hypothetical protein
MIKILFWVFVVIFFGGITFDLILNIINLRKCSVKSFEGEPVEIDATVDEQTKHQISTLRGAPAGMSQNLGTIMLSYKADGISFTKEAALIDVASDLKKGDTVKILYDSLNSGRAVLADGSEEKSAKNGIKWDICWYLVLLIAGAFVFLTFISEL